MFSQVNAVVLVEWSTDDGELPSSVEDLGQHLPGDWCQGKRAKEDHAMAQALSGLTGIGADWTGYGMVRPEHPG